MSLVQTVKMDKSHFSVVSLSETSDEKAYWLMRSPEERLQALEMLRQIMYGYDPATERLQRVFTVLPFPER
jgi:hypothetical protein